MAETTIGVEKDVRDRIRELKGHDRTYNEFLREKLLGNDE